MAAIHDFNIYIHYHLKHEQIEMHKDIISILYHVCIFDVRHKHNDQLKLKCTNSFEYI